MIDKIIQKYPQLTGHEDIVEFTLELQKVFGVTGFYFTNSEGKTIVGRPTTGKKQETQKQYRERWKRWRFLEKQRQK